MSDETNLNDFLRFRRMITPLLIEVIFWIGVIVAVLAALGMIIAGFTTTGFMGVLLGLVMLVLGPLYVRVACEVTIIFFRINETLTDIKNQNGPSEQG